MFDSPVTGAPRAVRIGSAPRTFTFEPVSLTCRIVGSKVGDGNVRRFVPSTLIWPLGPRSVTSQKVPGASSSPL
jgi:hypothetical protein